MNARPSLAGSRWSQRTPDQCFDSVHTLRDHVHARRARAEVRRVPLAALRPVPSDGRVDLELDGEVLRPTPWAAARYSAEVGLPAQAVQVLSPGLATAALQERSVATRNASPDHNVEVLIERTAGRPPSLRALVSTRYVRAWDADVVETLLQPLVARGWVPARARDDRAALFTSDRDLFCFLVHEDAPLELDGVHPRPLRRGLLLRNSEVGGVALRVQTFWFDAWCTNHMIFGARDVVDLREMHRSGGGGPLERLLDGWAAWGGFARLDAAPTEAVDIARVAAETPLAALSGREDEVVEEAVTRARVLASRARATSVLRVPLLRDAAERALDHYRAPGDRALTLWALAGGLTEAAQDRFRFAGERNKVDQAVGRMLTHAFWRSQAG